MSDGDFDGTTWVDVRPGAKWPWLVLAAGISVVLIGGVAYSPDELVGGGDQPASLATR